MCEVIFAAPRSASQQDPVGGAITGPAKAVRIDERLGKPDWVPIHALPVARQSRRHAAENVRGQMRHLYPRQDQVACVVRDKSNVPLASLLTPADEIIPAAQMPRRRTPGHAGDGSAMRP